jgi:hypothetical protein
MVEDGGGAGNKAVQIAIPRRIKTGNETGKSHAASVDGLEET